MNPDLAKTFDRVVIINLARRPDRLERWRQKLADWPFETPRRFDAIDGSAIPTPPDWDKGAGAWGCMLSHRAVIKTAIKDSVSSVLVLEDDAVPIEGFSRAADDFLNRVPDDWDCLMFGAEHLWPPEPIAPGIVRCTGANRMHAYAIRGKMMGVLLACLQAMKNNHCDVILASLVRYYKTYAPDPLLIGQDSGHSDISGRGERLRFLATEEKELIAEKDPRYCIEKLVTRLPKFPEPYVPAWRLPQIRAASALNR